MRTCLKIGIPYIINSSETTRLCADVELIKGNVCIREKETLWYETSLEYGKYLCYERMDSFLVNLLFYAMEHDYDIICDGKTTERLYYQLTEYLIPCVSRNIKEYHSIRITSNLDNGVLPMAGVVGTGISGGVDSFYTILRHMNRKEELYNVTHLLMTNSGTNGSFGGEDARRLFHERRDALMPAVQELNLKLVCIDTNINEFILQKQKTALIKLYSNVLALQKLFCCYYVGSGYPAEEFQFSIEDAAYFDLIDMHCFSTNNLTFYCSGIETSRAGKLNFISNFDVARNYLDVCVGSNAGNCGKCEKCVRTITGLYAIDKLDEFENVFDVNGFYKKKQWYLREVVCSREKIDVSEIYEFLKSNRKLPISVRIYGWMYVFVRAIYRKTLRRWIRGV